MSSKKIQILKSDLKQLAELFGTEVKTNGGVSSLILINRIKSTKISVDIIKDKTSVLISVYTENAHLQLQNCDYFIISEMLTEAIFVSETETTVSGLIISKAGDCSLYSNVSKELLKADYSQLESEKLISAIALSLTEI